MLKVSPTSRVIFILSGHGQRKIYGKISQVYKSFSYLCLSEKTQCMKSNRFLGSMTVVVNFSQNTMQVKMSVKHLS